MTNKLEGNNLNRFLATATDGPSTQTGNDLEGNPLLPSAGETIDSPWGQSTVERLIPRYSSAAVRDASLLDPDDGQMCFVLEVDELQIFSGGVWVAVPNRDVADLLYLSLAGGTVNGQIDITRVSRVLMNLRNETNPATDGTRVQMVVEHDGGLVIRHGSANGATAVHDTHRLAIGDMNVYGTATDSPFIGFFNPAGAGGTHDFRFRLDSGSEVRLQSSPKGTGTWTTLELWTAP